MSHSVGFVVPLGLAEYNTVVGRFSLQLWPGRLARYNDASQVILAFDWRGGDFKQFVSVVIEIKIFWPIWITNIELCQIYMGFMRPFFSFTNACIVVRFPVC